MAIHTSGSDRLIVALDVQNISDAFKLIDTLYEKISWVKIGYALQKNEHAHAITHYAHAAGMKVMSDDKLFDIPSTIQSAVNSISRIADSFTIHALAGSASVRAAAESKRKSLMLAVTILTSIQQSDMYDIGFVNEISDIVIKLAQLATHNGADGIVCSPRELHVLHQYTDKNGLPPFITYVPGIRPAWHRRHGQDDGQKRTMTPTQAMRAGAHFLIVGRPIIQHRYPAEAAERIIEELHADAPLF